MSNRYGVAALITIIIVISLYVAKFFPIYGFQLAGDSAIWGQFGDYVGGVLNPVLSFISVILLIRSVTLQNEANLDLRKELKDGEKTEKLRSFSILFFNMIDSQKILLRSLRLAFPNGTKQNILHGTTAVLNLENDVENLLASHVSKDEIRRYIESVDINDHLYGILRSFYITVKVVTDRLSDANKFGKDDREEYLLTLINFTDFAQLRVILMAVQFLDYPAASYLRDNLAFREAISKLDLALDQYQ